MINELLLTVASAPLRLFELARVLVRFDHVASFIVNANHSAMWAAVKLCLVDYVANQKAIKGSVNMSRTRTLSNWSGNCGLAELVLST
jgi:hypothetical protein